MAFLNDLLSPLEKMNFSHVRFWLSMKWAKRMYGPTRQLTHSIITLLTWLAWPSLLHALAGGEFKILRACFPSAV
jgi:hypothetical protein